MVQATAGVKSGEAAVAEIEKTIADATVERDALPQRIEQLAAAVAKAEAEARRLAEAAEPHRAPVAERTAKATEIETRYRAALGT